MSDKTLNLELTAAEALALTASAVVGREKVLEIAAETGNPSNLIAALNLLAELDRALHKVKTGAEALKALEEAETKAKRQEVAHA